MITLPNNVSVDPALTDREGVFDDRADAGAALADLMRPAMSGDELVLAIPSGGVPVAEPVARLLDLELDALVVSKITLPWNSEAGFGALAADGTTKINEELLSRLPMDDEQVEAQKADTKQKVERRERKLRQGRGALDLSGRSVVLVDDGLASGFTMMVAIEGAENLGAASVSVAVPTGHVRAVERIAARVDRLFCANVRSGSPFAVASAYRAWRDVPEGEAIELLGG